MCNFTNDCQAATHGAFPSTRLLNIASLTLRILLNRSERWNHLAPVRLDNIKLRVTSAQRGIHKTGLNALHSKKYDKTMIRFSQ